jgi:hypothetical protein
MASAKTKNQTGVFKRHFKFSAAIVLLVLLIGAYFVYEKVALEMNKRDFQQARAAIDNVYSEIVHQVGQPDNFKKYNLCDTYKNEFENGPISCNVNVDFIYSVRDEDDANIILKKLQKIILDNGLIESALANFIQDRTVGNSYFHDAIDNYEYSKLRCVSKYIYDTPSETYLTVKNKNRKSFQINLGCAGLAKDNYY